MACSGFVTEREIFTADCARGACRCAACAAVVCTVYAALFGILAAACAGYAALHAGVKRWRARPHDKNKLYFIISSKQRKKR